MRAVRSSGEVSARLSTPASLRRMRAKRTGRSGSRCSARSSAMVRRCSCSLAISRASSRSSSSKALADVACPSASISSRTSPMRERGKPQGGQALDAQHAGHVGRGVVAVPVGAPRRFGQKPQLVIVPQRAHGHAGQFCHLVAAHDFSPRGRSRSIGRLHCNGFSSGWPWKGGTALWEREIARLHRQVGETYS